MTCNQPLIDKHIKYWKEYIHIHYTIKLTIHIPEKRESNLLQESNWSLQYIQYHE